MAKALDQSPDKGLTELGEGRGGESKVMEFQYISIFSALFYPLGNW